LTRQVLRFQLLRELELTTWQRQKQAGKREELLSREDEGAKKWEKPLETSESLREDEV
jgi:hypothetical protein